MFLPENLDSVTYDWLLANVLHIERGLILAIGKKPDGSVFPILFWHRWRKPLKAVELEEELEKARKADDKARVSDIWAELRKQPERKYYLDQVGNFDDAKMHLAGKMASELDHLQETWTKYMAFTGAHQAVRDG